MNSKEALRLHLRALRRNLPPAARRLAARKAALHAARLLRQRRNVAIYLSCGSELATAPLVRRLLGRGHRLCAPRVQGDCLVFVALNARSRLRPNRFGILEPVATPRALRVDAVVMPLLAFDVNGRRLGQGGGYYDRALARSGPFRRPLRVGYGFSMQEVKRVPAQGHDLRLHAVVTERGSRWLIG